MKLIETWQDAAVREGFALGRSLKQIAAETGLSVLEVFQRQAALNLIPSRPMQEPGIGSPKCGQDSVSGSTMAPVTKLQ